MQEAVYNKEQRDRKEYLRQYYADNRDKVLKQMYRKVHCAACNKYISFCNLNKHYRTLKHIKNLKK